MNMYVSRAKKGHSKIKDKIEKKERDKMPKLDEFIKARDYTGATVLLEFQRQTGESVDANTLPWLGYCWFHLGEYKKALDIYMEILQQKSTSNAEVDADYYLYAACCQFYMTNYKEAEELAVKGPSTKLQNRLLFHISHRQSDETKLMKYHQKLSDQVDDQLSLASIHYLRSHFQEATDIYKKMLIDYRDYLALQVYVAMCYYKLDYYDVSLEILAPYLQSNPDSAIAINLKACNHYKLYDGRAAEQELKVMMDLLQASSQNAENDLIKHNLVVFRNGENALQVFPPLIDFIPEARLNLVIYHLRNDRITEAYELIKDLEPQTPQEYILKGVCNVAIGQMQDSREHLKLAQQFFQLVGASASECDTIPGRQCMASCFFILKQFDDVMIYMNSIQAYSYNDPTFNYNHGIALAACQKYDKAQEALLLVNDEATRNDYCYLSWLARCFIMTGKPREAWELYLKMDNNTDSFAMLVLIANDCYKVGHFFYSAKAFDVLERLDPSPEYWEGKRGACCGVFQQVIARKEKKEHLRDIIMMLRNQTSSPSPQAEFMIRVMKKWANENGMNIG